MSTPKDLAIQMANKGMENAKIIGIMEKANDYIKVAIDRITKININNVNIYR